MGDFAAEPATPSGGASVAFTATDLTIAASGTSDEFSVRGFRTLWVVAFLQGVTGGSPGITFYLEQQDANGHWIVTTQIGVAVTSAPNYTAGYAGDAAGGLLAGRARLSWSVTGGTFTGVDLSVTGR